MKYFFLSVVALLCLTGCEINQSKSNISKPEVKKEQPKVYENNKIVEKKYVMTQKNAISFLTEYGKNNPETKVRLNTTLGIIDIELYKETPLHRANFIHLVKTGYYSSTQFHRVVKDFIIQAGSADNSRVNHLRDSIGFYKIPPEFQKSNHHRGAVSQVRQWETNPNKNSDAYEFFIVIKGKGSHHLDNEHSVIGRVIRGMDVVEKIGNLKVDSGEWPLNEVHIDAEVLE